MKTFKDLKRGDKIYIVEFKTIPTLTEYIVKCVVRESDGFCIVHYVSMDESKKFGFNLEGSRSDTTFYNMYFAIEYSDALKKFEVASKESLNRLMKDRKYD